MLTIIKLKMQPSFTLRFKFEKVLPWKVIQYSYQFFYFWFHISFYISRYHFFTTFQSFIQNYLKKIFAANFPFLTDSHNPALLFFLERISRTAILTQASVITCKWNFQSFSCICFPCLGFTISFFKTINVYFLLWFHY